MIDSQYSYLEEFIGDDDSDPKKNWQAFCSCIEIGKPIFLKKVYRLSASVTFFTDKDIVVKGSNKETCGLVFLNKNVVHFDSTREPVYVDGVEIGKASGVNMLFEDVSLTTGNFEQFKKEDYIAKKFNDFYPLQYVNAPNRIVDVDYIKFKDCFIGGALQITFMGAFRNTPVRGVKAIDIEDNYIEHPYLLVSAWAHPKETNINRNKIKNLRQTLVSISQGENIYLNDNYVENDFIIEPGMSYSEGYISLVTASAKKLVGRRNVGKNLLSRSGANTFMVYPSVDSFIWEDNESIDVFYISDKGETPLILLKQAKNVVIKRNRVTITKDAFVKLGLLQDINSSIESIGDKYKFCIISASKDAFDSYNGAEITDNVFTTPFINMGTHLMTANNTIVRNVFNIDYIAPITSTTLFYRAQTLFNVEGGKRGTFKLNDNIFNIGKAANSEFNVVGMKHAPHDVIENCNNSYYVTVPTNINFGRFTFGKEYGEEGHQSQTYKATGNFVNKGSIEDTTAIAFDAFPYPMVESNNVGYTIGNLAGKTAELHVANLESFGVTEVKVLQNSSDSLGLFRFLTTDFMSKTLNPYFNGIKYVDIIFKITALNSNAVEETLFYKVTANNRLALTYSGAKFSPTDKSLFSREVKNTENKVTHIKLLHRNFKSGSDASYLVLGGLSNYKSFTVSISVQKN